ncbi:MAG: response regulator, partial [Pseudomonadota bacterium]
MRSVPTSDPASILVVDDDTDMREGLCDALIEEGYAVSAAINGAEAVRKLVNTSRPDLILMDLRMPVMDGYEFLKRRDGDESLNK